MNSLGSDKSEWWCFRTRVASASIRGVYKNWISGNRLGWAGSFYSLAVNKGDTPPDAKPVESDMTRKNFVVAKTVKEFIEYDPCPVL